MIFTPLPPAPFDPAAVKPFVAGGFAHRCLPPRRSQGSALKCVSAAICSAMEWCRAVAGLALLRLDEGDLHGRIETIDGSGQRQASVGDGIVEAVTNGVGGVRIAKRWHCPTPASVWNAAHLGLGIVAVVGDWRQGNRTDADGWLVEGGGLVYGHAIFGYKPWMRRTRTGPEYGIVCQNSVGSFAPQTAGCVAVPVTKLAGAMAVQSVTYSE